MENLVELERNIQTLYDEVLRPLAKRTEFELPMSQKDAPGVPTVLFLGNHSSGKSSFINYLVEADVQDLGIAGQDFKLGLGCNDAEAAPTFDTPNHTHAR